ncbi:MAG: STAS domain-containing protein [bacterium]|nr:STAS domain-containing protein [bacterium]
MSILIEREAAGGGTRIRIRGELVFRNIAEAHAELKESLAELPPAALDLSGVEDLDTSGVQLLIALKQEFARSGRVLRLVEHSPIVLEFFALYGLVGFFGDRIVLKKGEKEKYGFAYGLKRERESL